MPNTAAVRRPPRTAALVLLAVLTLVLAACGGAGGDGAPGADGAAGGTAPAAADAFPVTIEHALGTTEIEERPERVVTLGYGEGDIVAALGVTPLAVNAYGTRGGTPSPWLAAAVGGEPVELLDLAPGIPYERIAALDPDVILALLSDIDAGEHELLSAIAPTVAYQVGPYQDAWEDASRTAGRALGLEAEAEALVDGVDGAIRAAAAAHPGLAGRTVSVVLAISPEQVGVLNSPRENTVRMLTELGMELPPAVADLEVGPTGYSAVLSREQVGVLDADALLLYAITDQAREALTTDALFGGLGVTRRGDVLAIEPATWSALRTPSVLSIPYAVERLIEPLSAAVAG